VGSSPAMEPEVNQALLSLLGRLPGRRVAVVGDAMLDEYVWGEARRISPEAPVPVVEVRQRTFAPGGCGNVAVNVASLGGAAELGAVVGSSCGYWRGPEASSCRARIRRGVTGSQSWAAFQVAEALRLWKPSRLRAHFGALGCPSWYEHPVEPGWPSCTLGRAAALGVFPPRRW